MKKVNLKVEDLEISSFATSAGQARAAGTVRGKEYTEDCPGYGCTQGNSTCEYPTNRCCPDTFTYDNPRCYELQPRTYYCFCNTDFYECGPNSAPDPC